MIITRTPYRISFFGGGTDYPVWYEKNGGAVLAASINKYCHITCRLLPPFFHHKHRIVYSQTELTNRITDIDHPSVRETLRFLKWKKGIEEVKQKGISLDEMIAEGEKVRGKLFKERFSRA